MWAYVRQAFQPDMRNREGYAFGKGLSAWKG
jgi:hypothetical protein